MPDASCSLVWFVTLPPIVASDALVRCNAILDEDEQARAAAFRIDAARQEFVVAHALVRVLLSGLAPVPPGGWRFGRGTHGKPFVAEPRAFMSLRFSLSHTRGVVAAAVSTAGDVGVDVETAHRPVEIAHYRSCLSDPESDALNAISPEARAERFFELWTAKEAIVKAVGTGVSGAMANIEMVTRNGSSVSRCSDPRYDGWRISRASLPGKVQNAVATREAQPVTVRISQLADWLRDAAL